MFRRISGGALALLLAATFALPAAAGQQRPMKGTFSGSPAAVDPRCGPDALTIAFTLQGVATHLGRFTGSGSNCTEFDFFLDSAAIWEGLTIIKAADGSTLTLDATGLQQAPVDGIASYSHTDNVLGGTGRFANATGVLTISGQINFNTGSVTGTVEGWLSY
ncbi:hypothetical protein BH23CHL7_BH23CHL7_22260 [soil metagenome]